MCNASVDRKLVPDGHVASLRPRSAPHGRAAGERHSRHDKLPTCATPTVTLAPAILILKPQNNKLKVNPQLICYRHQLSALIQLTELAGS